MKALKNSRGMRLSLDLIFVIILILYPMRHIHWGLDLWDTGYNYANFTYMGTEHMDSMWLFSTYLSTVIGHFLTLLPGAGGLLGMNFYTGLFASLSAVVGYAFCTKSLGMPRWIAFVGEMLALSLCWCPTALLYNYITYAILLGCIVFLYVGLTKDRMGFLFVAGVCLGCNVLVRFSNLPEMALIMAVWAWDFILWLEGKRKGRPARHTLWCLGGYLFALAVLLGFIHIRYGFGNYMAGIQRLFAMTDNATDYKAKSMLMGVVGTYVENLYWVVRIGVIILVGVVVFALVGMVLRRIEGDGAEKAAHAAKPVRAIKLVHAITKILWGCAAALLLSVWLYKNHFYSFQYFSYDSMVKPATLFLMLAMLIGAVRILHPKAPKEEKLISGMVVLVVLLTSIGSNNGVYPSINNLFVVGPYVLWECWQFLRSEKEWSFLSGRIGVSAFPIKAVMAAFLVLVLVQSAGFGANFVFVEATGAQNITSVIENNKVLKKIKMSPERAMWMSEISAYAQENGLQGREVLLFGQIPALSYYLQMPSVFNPWSDLRSYSYEAMECDMRELDGEMAEKGTRPVIILDREYFRQYEWYLEGGSTLLREHCADENRADWIVKTADKYLLLKAFAEKNHYSLTFENEKFVVYE